MKIALTAGLCWACAMPAMVLAQIGSVELPVNAHMDLYQAGGYKDGSDGIAPTVYSFPAKAGRILSFSSVTGEWTCSSAIARFGADGTTNGLCYGASIVNPVGTLSGYKLTDFAGAMAGVFLEDSLPSVPRPPSRFYISNKSEGGIQTDFHFLSPRIGQIFFIGDGLTGTGTGSIQGIEVPPTATHLYLGFVDSCTTAPNSFPGCYSDNEGSMLAVFRFRNLELDWDESQVETSPSARSASAMAYDAARDLTVLFGGASQSTFYNDTWVWNNGWLQLFPSASPSPRAGASVVYDPGTRTVLLFGGSTVNEGEDLGDTWTWDGVTWTQQFPPVSPSPRDSSGIAYDENSGTVLLFGGSVNGSGGGDVLSDTWVWNGISKTWTQQFPASSPSPRRTTMAYDAAHRNIVLFGGDTESYGCCDPFYSDTWVWNGGTWTEQFPVSAPGTRTLNSLTFDDSIGRLVLFGGYNSPGNALNDTWTWDGTNWNQQHFNSAPAARWSPAVDYDPNSGGLVLFGGVLSGFTWAADSWVLVGRN